MTNITYYCLGNGAIECDGCGKYVKWLEFNQLPDTLRKVLQRSAKRIDDTACILSGRIWYETTLTTP